MKEPVKPRNPYPVGDEPKKYIEVELYPRMHTYGSTIDGSWIQSEIDRLSAEHSKQFVISDFTIEFEDDPGEIELIAYQHPYKHKHLQQDYPARKKAHTEQQKRHDQWEKDNAEKIKKYQEDHLAWKKYKAEEAIRKAQLLLKELNEG
jgi:hypothetical protein